MTWHVEQAQEPPHAPTMISAIAIRYVSRIDRTFHLQIFILRNVQQVVARRHLARRFLAVFVNERNFDPAT